MYRPLLSTARDRIAQGAKYPSQSARPKPLVIDVSRTRTSARSPNSCAPTVFSITPTKARGRKRRNGLGYNNRLSESPPPAPLPQRIYKPRQMQPSAAVSKTTWIIIHSRLKPILEGTMPIRGLDETQQDPRRVVTGTTLPPVEPMAPPTHVPIRPTKPKSGATKTLDPTRNITIPVVIAAREPGKREPPVLIVSPVLVPITRYLTP
ncbi:hypothetical protein SISSUDRAFT_626357 [Sistotremastrum suecicum HHB10207 ss-3]|uniref:Uncharacterized protein n=1 Tax=Sistotremastrum suecicum HHB10207 ss-3 TaxID=1314776 RepID=A0A165XA97_9AGAM|nr:hypothetical protein SISSUDRAFT_626357 [Sistotremastrum suecicum HHB10207 ss-3]